MKTQLLVAALAATGALIAAPAFAASTTHTLSVSATVTGNCKFNTAGPTALTIATGAGVIDPSAAGPATGTANVTFRCTTGTTSGITGDNGLNFSAGTRRVKNGVANFMNYALTLTNAAQLGSGFGAGQDKTVLVDASIIAADYQNATAGAYTDTVTLTITP
jgi:spore coat protein U-like protein